MDVTEDKTIEKDQLRSYVVENIDRAIEERWIRAYYQPIIRGSSGSISNEETLARWNDPVKGMLFPDQFIPALEESGQIYKLDLHMLDELIRAFKAAEAAGLYMVPNSLNLSREDFDHCDMVEEIKSRVDAAGLDHRLFNIEITESVVGRDFEFMKLQIKRFRELGFRVWMDDFGSGYSSLDYLQRLDFDVVKLDMNFMREFETNDKTRIILTELIKLSTSLGIETIMEGVETEEQVDFLREVGCTKLQGYYFSRPVSLEDILERNANGIEIGYENPGESPYYEAIGRISLFDLDDSNSEDTSILRKFFDALPVAILEYDGEHLRVARCNKSYKEFLKRCFGMKDTSRNFDHMAVMTEKRAGIFDLLERSRGLDHRMLFEERINGQFDISGFVRHSADNELNGMSAFTMVILSIKDDNDNNNVTFADVAKALASDYVYLYYIDLVSDDFVEYSPDAAHGNLSVERHGKDFFNASHVDAHGRIYPEDLKRFLDSFTKENIIKAIESVGTYTLSYRLLQDGSYVYVSMKAVTLNKNHIVIGVSDVDAYMRHIESLERAKEESITYARISALSGEYLAIYTIDPATDEYLEYSNKKGSDGLGLGKKGRDFFEKMRRFSPNIVHSADLDRYLLICTKENMLHDIEHSGLFEYNFRLVLDGEPIHVSLRAARIEEKDGPRLIVGVSNIDEMVRRNQEYEASLTEARNLVNIDGLTGVKNKHAYLDAETELNEQIKDGRAPEFSIVVLDLNGLKDINDAHGHQTGDNYIRAGCRFICEVFDHSPVFRVGGDEFAVISRGHDHKHMDELMEVMRKHNERCIEMRKEAPDSVSRQMTVSAGSHDRNRQIRRDYSGARAGHIYDFNPDDVIIACGCAHFENDPNVASVFDRADLAMYMNKKEIKER